MDWLKTGSPQVFDATSRKLVAGHALGLSKLSYGAGGSAYVQDPAAPEDDPDPDYDFAQIIADEKDLFHVRFWRVRRSQLPSIHNSADGSTAPLGLQATEGLAEATDFVFFPKSCVVGLLVNRAGPSRASVLAYVERQTGLSLKLVPLTRDDALDLINGDRVAAVDVEVAAGHFEALANVSEEMGKAAKAVDAPGIKTMRVSLSADRDDRAGFWMWWKPRAKKLLGLPKTDVKRLEVVQAASAELASHVVDLLEEQIGLEVSVPVETGRTVEPEEGRGAILEGYNSYLDLIQRAADGLDAHAENQRTERKKPEKRASEAPDNVQS